MYYSIDFGDLDEYGVFRSEANTWDDWYLIPSSRPTIVTPQSKVNFVSIPGRHGSINLTNYLRGTRPSYGPRTGSLEFYVDNDHEHWMNIRKKIGNVLHGKRIKMVLEDEPVYYYEGRFVFNAWKSDANFSKVVIDYQLDPYKYSISKSVDDAHLDELDIWDNLCFDIDKYKPDVIWSKMNTNTNEYDFSTSQIQGGKQVVYKKDRITGGLL